MSAVVLKISFLMSVSKCSASFCSSCYLRFEYGESDTFTSCLLPVLWFSRIWCCGVVVHDFLVLRSSSYVCSYFSNVFILNRWCWYCEIFLFSEWTRETRQSCFAVTVSVFVCWFTHFGCVSHRVGVAKALYSTRDRVFVHCDFDSQKFTNYMICNPKLVKSV